MTKSKTPREEKAALYRLYIRTSVVGLEVGLSIIVGILAGHYIDKHFGFSPYGMLIGLLIGSIAAGKRLYKVVKEYG